MPARDRARWLQDEVLVEEKLDGANVAVWCDDAGYLQVAGRGGPGALDRGRQLGRLRAWAAERADALHALLAAGHAMYGEWLWLEHTLSYTRLPDYLVVLDLWSPAAGFADADERDRRVKPADLVVPPRLHTGTICDVERLERLTRRSAFTNGPAEGAVLRREHADGRFDRCKWVRVEFQPRSNEAWLQERRHNQVQT